MPDPISWEFSGPYLLAAFLGGYLVGSIPFGLLLTRLAGLGDIRDIGSGSIGATNVLRAGHKWVAAATLLLDGAKGAVAVLLGQLFGPDLTVMAAAGALLGHCFPVWLKFRGGKGVATALGIYLALAWPVGALACVTWLAVAAAFRYSSLASLAAMALAPVTAVFFASPQQAELAAFIAVVTVLRHHANIRRLVKGTESKIALGKGGTA